MDKLKDFIDNNRDAFNDEQLPKGHFERFEKKLPNTKQKNIRFFSFCAFIAAASIALLFLLKLPGGTSIPTSPEAAVPQYCKIQSEIKELTIYYNMQMNDILAQMEELYKKENTPGTTELLQETKRVLSANYIFEKTVLPTLPCSNDGLYAMNQHYSNSLESLNFMLKQMEEMNK